MNVSTRHRKAAKGIWECGGRLDEVAVRQGVSIHSLRRWLMDPKFRSLVASNAAEPLMQATGAVLRWAPVAVARLIQDLQGDSPGEARQAAREILKLALEAQRELASGGLPGQAICNSKAPEPLPPAHDPLSQSVAALPDDQLAKLLAMLNDTPKGTAR